MGNTIIIRIGNFAAGIVVARLVAPEQFGIFAVALTVQSILAAFADLGLTADLIRNGRIRERAATATTVSLVVTALLALLMTGTAGLVSSALGSPEATPVVQLMSLTLLLNGLCVVPFSILQRELRQRAVFGIEVVSFLVSTVFTILLLVLGFGAMALVIARVLSQVATCVLQYIVTRTPLRFGLDREVARGLVLTGVPLAAANMLSWVVMNVDYMVVGSIGGALILGFYLLAFNISSWPMTALGQAIRPVALPAFSGLSKEGRASSLSYALALAWTPALLIGVVFSCLAVPVITTVYGDKWAAAAAALGGLALFGATRVVIDLMATFLISAGANRAVLLVQIVWLVGLIPAMVIGVRGWGLSGAGWSHVVASALFVLPAYAVALARAGVRLRTLAAAMGVPLLAAVPSAVVTLLIARWLGPWPILAVLVGGLAGTVVFLAPLFGWLRSRFHLLRAHGGAAEPVDEMAVVA